MEASMTDWGIPNWRDPAAYGDTKRWSERRWRWEFTRRRPDCRKDFLTHKDETVRYYEEVRALEVARSPQTKQGRLLRPDEPGFVAQVPGCNKKYGLTSLPNPAIGDQPFYVIQFFPVSAAAVFALERSEHAKQDQKVTLPDGRVIDESLASLAWSIGLHDKIEPLDALIAIDLSAPIQKQLDRARLTLEYMQKKKIGKVVRPRKHRDKWLTYLRVLDAKESGLSLSKTAKYVLGPTERDGPAQFARDVWKQAQALRSKWPD
jgi:hypothetical protein